MQYPSLRVASDNFQVGMENVLVIPEAVAVFTFCRESGILSENKESVSQCPHCIVLECEGLSLALILKLYSLI